MNRNSGSHIPPARVKISRVDYSKHEHARLISVVVGVFALLAVFVWGWNAVG